MLTTAVSEKDVCLQSSQILATVVCIKKAIRPQVIQRKYSLPCTVTTGFSVDYESEEVHNGW